LLLWVSWLIDWLGTLDCAVLTDCADWRSPSYLAARGTGLTAFSTTR
jgi:hypothetical protein